jgi:hypothetical protein
MLTSMICQQHLAASCGRGSDSAGFRVLGCRHLCSLACVLVNYFLIEKVGKHTCAEAKSSREAWASFDKVYCFRSSMLSASHAREAGLPCKN